MSDETVTESAGFDEKAPLGAADVSTVLAGVSRLLTKLSELDAFRETKLGMTDWLFLRLLLDNPSLRAGRIATKLGVTVQRSAQIAGALKKAGYISVVPLPEDARKKELKITEAGQSALERWYAEIARVFSGAIKDRPRALNGMRALIHKVSAELKA